MCVAVVVETRKGPTKDEMEAMDAYNPHGVGLGWGGNNLLYYRKGLTWQGAYKLLQDLPRPTLLHFRWATHGGRGQHLTHPFPLGHNAFRVSLSGAADALLIHNGVWRNYLKFAPKFLDLKTWSDTAVAAYAAEHIGEHILDDVDWSTAVARAAGKGRMDVTLRGNWTTHKGNSYSNLSWMPRKVSPTRSFKSDELALMDLFKV